MSEPAPSLSSTLRQLYLTLFLRGRTSRGLQKEQVPKSLASKLKATLAVYALSGLVALFFSGQPPYLLSLYLHGMTLFFLVMFVASTAGEVLFNKDEAEILLHRPVEPRALLWAKVGVLLRVSLWMACTFNLTGLVVGTVGRNGSWTFAPAHLVSTCLAALFCSGSVVLLYQLCLHWFGRERLDNLMTTAQVLLMVVLIGGSQAIPHVMDDMEGASRMLTGQWWLYLLPPVWFAALDEVLAGRGTTGTLSLSALGVALTAAVLALAFGKLTRVYQEGLQSLAESRPQEPRAAGKRWMLDRIAAVPPLSWTLRDPVVRSSFRLTAAYMLRDRDMKLRLYPGLAPVLMMPAIFLLQGAEGPAGGFGIAMAGGYLGLIPLMAMNLLQYSQHWQAADIFRLAPVTGPAPFVHGAIRAVAVLLLLPGLAILAAVVFLMPHGADQAKMLLPGLIALPAYTLLAGVLEKAAPLSRPTEEAKASMRGVAVFLLMILSLILPGLGVGAEAIGVFPVFLGIELLIVAGACFALNAAIFRKSWDALE